MVPLLFQCAHGRVSGCAHGLLLLPAKWVRAVLPCLPCLIELSLDMHTMGHECTMESPKTDEASLLRATAKALDLPFPTTATALFFLHNTRASRDSFGSLTSQVSGVTSQRSLPGYPSLYQSLY